MTKVVVIHDCCCLWFRLLFGLCVCEICVPCWHPTKIKGDEKMRYAQNARDVFQPNHPSFVVKGLPRGERKAQEGEGGTMFPRTTEYTSLSYCSSKKKVCTCIEANSINDRKRERHQHVGHRRTSTRKVENELGKCGLNVVDGIHRS